MTDRLRVYPDKLRPVATRFSATAAELGGAIPRFDAAVSDVEEAFGALGPSTGLYYEYLGLARTAVMELERLRDALHGAATGLLATADNYADAEAAAVIPGFGGAG